MQDRDPMSDEIPVADAVEQAQRAGPEPVDAVEVPGETPVEAPTADWHEQRQEVVGADDWEERDDRDEYRQ
jgi:hypothetical protein